MDYLNIGSVPCDEECVQTGGDDPDYAKKQRIECTVFKHQLERLFPGGIFKGKTFQHDFGSYSEVVAYFDESREDAPSTKAAFAAEANMPEKWDALAKEELAARLAEFKIDSVKGD